ncbi:hypothetical protein ACEQ8H_000149 [Pleosporales sp. CAS-2024a]
MQNFGHAPGYPSPGSTASFSFGRQPQAPPPAGYGGYQAPVSPNQGQHRQPPNPWSQAQQPQAASGYTQYTRQQHVHHVPPPPPPKPRGFAAAVQRQQAQSWMQQPQQNTSTTPQQHGGYPVQGLVHSLQPYSHVAPPPPDVPAWQQAQHAPLQETSNNFRYTKPPVDPGFYAQGYQGAQQQPQNPYTQPSVQPSAQYSRPDLSQPPQMASNASKPLNEWEMPLSGTDAQYPRWGTSNIPKPVNQWETPAPAPVGQTWHPHQQSLQQASVNVQPQGSQSYGRPAQHHAQDLQSSIINQPHVLAPGHAIPAPRSLARTDTASADFFSKPTPQSQPVSPVNNGHSMSLNHQSGDLRSASASSIALANLHAQRQGSRTTSPKYAPSTLPTSPPPPRDHKSKFSALGSGGPSDWEHFGAHAEIDDEDMFARKPGPAELDSSEIPSDEPEPRSGPSPPSTHGWPSPAPGVAGYIQDTYQPTPPPVIATLADRTVVQPPQRTFTIKDAAPAPLTISPESNRVARLPYTQQSSEADHSDFVVPKSSTPVHQHTHHQAQQPPPLNTGYARGGEAWETSQTPAQVSSTQDFPPTEQLNAELQGESEALEHLRSGTDRDKADLHAEVDRLKEAIELTRAQASDAAADLQKQVQAMKLHVEQTRSTVEAVNRENDLTIERMKEHVEGMEHNIEERDILIADLKRQLEAEKSKEPAKITSTPADLIPDLDPWYASSLERYIAMLRSEAGEPELENKIKIFRAFIKAESSVRGIEFFEAPPSIPTHASTVGQVPETKALTGSNRDNMNVQVPKSTKDDSDEGEYSPGGRPCLAREATIPATIIAPLLQASNASKPALTRDDLNVQISPRHQFPDEEDCEFSPGGRPVIQRKSTVPSSGDTPATQPCNSSTLSMTILTPTSSIDDDSSRTPVQAQLEDLSQSVYKAYVPPALPSSDSWNTGHRPSLSNVAGSTPFVSASSTSFDLRPVVRTCTGQQNNEVFLESPQKDTSTGASRPTSSDSCTSGPAPLPLSSNRSASTTPPPKKNPIETLRELLLPTQLGLDSPNRLIESYRTKLTHINQDPISVEDLTKKWDTAATAIRKKNEAARRKREEEQEGSNDDAFNNEEISYADLNMIEQEFKQKENDLKAQEDRAEYASYVEAVFDPVYDALQSSIKSLMDLKVEVEEIIVQSSRVDNMPSSEPGALSTVVGLQLLQEIHNAVLSQQDKVVAAVAERDKRYKKTEIQPLYARGDMSRMKAVAKHFETTEKTAHVRALRDRATRMGKVVDVVQDIVVSKVGIQQGQTEEIVAALRALDHDGTCDDADVLLDRASKTLTALKTNSKCLLQMLHHVDLRHHAAVLDAEIAQARLEGNKHGDDQVAKLEAEKNQAQDKMDAELQTRIRVMEQHVDEAEALVASKRSQRGEARDCAVFLLVIDESHNIGAYETMVWTALRWVQADFYLLLTATPVPWDAFKFS